MTIEKPNRSYYYNQEPINRSLHMHCILESTFARIFLFLELPFLQEAQFYRENLFPVKSAHKHPKWNGGERRERVALFWLGILNNSRESCHPQCSTNKKIRAKVDSEGLYGKRRFLFMGSCSNHSQQDQTARWTNENSQQLLITCSKRGKNRAYKVRLVLICC